MLVKLFKYSAKPQVWKRDIYLASIARKEERLRTALAKRDSRETELSSLEKALEAFVISMKKADLARKNQLFRLQEWNWRHTPPKVPHGRPHAP